MAGYKQAVMKIDGGTRCPVVNPRVANESWLAINFVPPEYHGMLRERLDRIQQQAVHMTAIKLRESGMPEIADLIDPGAT